MEITKLYLYESAVVIVRHNQVFLEHNCFFSSKGSELRKCLLKKNFKKLVKASSYQPNSRE